MNGRPRKSPGLDELVGKILYEEKNGITTAERIIRALCKRVCRGNVMCAELLLNRAYGKIKQDITINTSTSQNLIAKVEIVKIIGMRIA